MYVTLHCCTVLHASSLCDIFVKKLFVCLLTIRRGHLKKFAWTLVHQDYTLSTIPHVI